MVEDIGVVTLVKQCCHCSLLSSLLVFTCISVFSISSVLTRNFFGSVAPIRTTPRRCALVFESKQLDMYSILFNCGRTRLLAFDVEREC